MTFKKKSMAQWKTELEPLDVCFAPIANIEEVMEDPQFLAREMIVDFEDHNGEKTKTLGIPIKLSDTPGSLRTQPVKFGGNTGSILTELGYSEEQINRFEEKSVI